MITWKAVLKIQGSTRIEGRKGGKYLEEDATHGWQWRKLVRMDVRVLTGAQPDPPLLVWLLGVKLRVEPAGLPADTAQQAGLRNPKFLKAPSQWVHNWSRRHTCSRLSLIYLHG